MNEKIISNIVIIIVVIIIIKMASPEPDSVLYILQKYLNYFIYQFKKIFFGERFTDTNNTLFDKNVTFSGIQSYNPVAPSFKTPYENTFIKFYKNKYPDIAEKSIIEIYHFINSLVTLNVDSYFSTPSEVISNRFTNDELDKIKSIIVNKLNFNMYKFTNFIYEYEPVYYKNSAGKEVDPFVFKINSDIGLLRIYIDIDIRNDISQNQEYLVINEIKPVRDKQVIFSNQNIYYNSSYDPSKNTF